jgi:hypothetical protein
VAKPEADFVRKLLKALQKEFPGYWVKTSPSRFDKAGRPDILGTSAELAGVFCGIECKAPSVAARPSPAQQLNLDQINEALGIAFTTNSVEYAISTLREVQSYVAEQTDHGFAAMRFMPDSGDLEAKPPRTKKEKKGA